MTDTYKWLNTQQDVSTSQCEGQMTVRREERGGNLSKINNQAVSGE
jgi:hypothetical protein